MKDHDVIDKPTTTHQGKPAITFVLTGFAVFMVALDNLVITTALPSIRVDFGTGISGLQWTVSAYTLTYAMFQLTAAALGDRFGRRRIFLAGISIFTVASAAAALAPSIGFLIGARAVQGLGAAVVTPLSLTILANTVADRRRNVVLAAWTGISGLAIAFGPVVGGAIIEFASWHWIFWVNVPIGLVLVPLGAIRLGESRGGSARFDIPGTVLAAAGLFAIVLGLISGESNGWSSVATVGEIVAGVLLLTGFTLWERRAPHPVLPPALFANPGFPRSLLVYLVMGSGMFGANFLLMQFLQTAQGYSPLAAGVRMMPAVALPAFAAPLSGPLAGRIGARNVVAIGLALLTTGVAMLAVVTTPDVAYHMLLPALAIMGIGGGLFLGQISNMLLSFVPFELEGVASGTGSTSRQMGAVLGVSGLGAVFAANGGFDSPQHFTDGIVPAFTVAAVVTGIATAGAFLIPNSRRRPKPTTDAAEAPREEHG